MVSRTAVNPGPAVSRIAVSPGPVAGATAEGHSVPVDGVNGRTTACGTSVAGGTVCGSVTSFRLDVLVYADTTASMLQTT